MKVVAIRTIMVQSFLLYPKSSFERYLTKANGKEKVKAIKKRKAPVVMGGNCSSTIFDRVYEEEKTNIANAPKRILSHLTLLFWLSSLAEVSSFDASITL